MRGENRNYDVAIGTLQNADIVGDVRQEITGLMGNAEARAGKVLGKRVLYTWPRSIWASGRSISYSPPGRARSSPAACLCLAARIARRASCLRDGIDLERARRQSP